ncbi:hypothetical protein [Biostraticola tofi]|uniref:Uncharacterized protein n=1 Tax=Biostraticola tofi TaxID=466109 RepID=A0A4R3Z478_9GAMM|nr:hypothetical protein [Biostraticola tofi]TCV98708.1 hypothetical protein EDC52_10227 [Biostraticola tofi]
MNSRQPLFLLEINTPHIADWSFFQNLTTFIKKYHFQGIIIHQQNLLAQLARASPRCRPSDITNLNLSRENTLLLLKKISDYCDEHNLQLWLQGEATPDCTEIRKKFPEFFLNDSNKADFIYYFFQHSIADILERLPSVRGLRLSLSTEDVGARQWTEALAILYRNIRRLGRQLILRDYQDKTWPRQMLRTTLEALPADVRASVKTTELDYRPGFATNPNLLNITGNKKWLEIDLWGLDYGWTLLPCYLLDEFQQRLQWLNHEPDSAPEAITVRIDWEWLPQLSLRDSINEVNLYGLSRLIHEPDISPRQLLLDWLHLNGNGQLTHRTAQQIGDVIAASYEWSCITPNLLGRVLQSRSQPPANIEHALRLLHLDTRSANWTQSFQPLMPSDDPALGRQQCQLIELENQRSRFLADYMSTRSVKLLSSSGLTEQIIQNIGGSIIRAQKYTIIYYDFIQALTLKLLLRKYGQQHDTQLQLDEALALFAKHNHQLREWYATEGGHHPYSFQTLLNPERISELITSLHND